MVRKGIGTDPRVGSQFLFAGVGYGGSCFPKDVSALVKTSSDYKYDFKILKEVQEVNKNQRKRFAAKIIKHFDGNLKRKKIAVWGLAFKPNTDDMREAPSVAVINELLKHGATVHVHDPIAVETAKQILGKSVKYFKNNYDALNGVDALVIVTEWNEFRRPDFQRMKNLMKHLVIFDGRNIYDPAIISEMGFKYFSIGRNNKQ
jgi:UDPglucose 6-dehydrogenase